MPNHCFDFIASTRANVSHIHLAVKLAMFHLSNYDGTLARDDTPSNAI